jgi:arsenite methyltransferase
MAGTASFRAERAVKDRYAAAARELEPGLCCPVTYDGRYLELIPDEILVRDYGCGDPTPFVEPGNTVLDLGCGGGKICYIAAQIAGPDGKVIGVDFNLEMLALARKHQRAFAKRLGYDNLAFCNARIQDMAVSLDEVEAYLKARPVRTAADLVELERFTEDLRESAPLIANDSVDVVVSNCVLNLVPDSQKPQLFSEIYRVLKPGGRAVISDIVSDEDVPLKLKSDAHLWTGCLAGALREDRFLKAFEQAGFYGIEAIHYSERPWRTIRGIQFRSVTVRAWKGKEGPCLERKQAVIYKGPWKEVRDDDGHVLRRGERAAVCDKTYRILTRHPYADGIVPVPPLQEVPAHKAQTFACRAAALRDPRETKGARYRKTTAAADGCGAEGCC